MRIKTEHDRIQNAKRKREWYLENKKAHYERVKKNKKDKVIRLQALKMFPCLDCEFNPIVPEQMHWDHLPERGPKSYGIATKARNMGFNNILKELEKCELVCANCHALRTYNRRILVHESDGKTLV